MQNSMKQISYYITLHHLFIIAHYPTQICLTKLIFAVELFIHKLGWYIPVYNQEQIKICENPKRNWKTKIELAIKQDCLANVNTSQAPKISWYLWIISIFFYLQKLKSHFLHLSFQTICVSLLQSVIGWHWSFALPASYCICHLFSWTKQSGIQNK